MSTPVSRERIVKFLNDYLQNSAVADASSNGLQVAGAERVWRVGLAVDASMQTYACAVKEGCQMLIVHHGFIWNGIKYVTGRNYEHIKYLVESGLNLFASHLPLDLHPRIGNNILLARILGLKKTAPCFNYHGVEIGYCGELVAPLSVPQIAARLNARLGGQQIILPFGKRRNVTVGIVSGGGADMLPQAIDKKLDCYITGEGAHHNHHEAREAGINVVFAGHYHTETCGVKALGSLLTKKFGVQTLFIDVPTIV